MVKKTYEKLLSPTYIEKFSCIGGSCEDTCCAGWTVLIDEETYKKYKKVKESRIKSRLDKEIVEKRNRATDEHAAKIKLKNGRCAFLSQQGLCDIYSILGEKYLSHTCALYPRTMNVINHTLECSLVLSCPEAARQILLQDRISFAYYENIHESYTISAEMLTDLKNPRRWQDYFTELRKSIIDILQNRNLPFANRLIILRNFMNELDKAISPSLIKKIPELIIQYAKMTKDSIIKDSINKEKSTKELYLELIGAIQILKEKNKLKSKRYLECLEIVYKGLEVNTQQNVTFSSVKFDEGLKGYTWFLQDEGTILENYFVNYVFERCVPIDSEKPSESFKRMNLYYHLIKLHLVGMAAFYKEIPIEQVVKLIQSFSKTFDHDDETFAVVLKMTATMI